jgi:NADH:ubiquinone oxidoreductase subunit C
MFKLFSDIYFVVYKLYYVSQNDNLSIRVSLKNWDRGSTLEFEIWAWFEVQLYVTHEMMGIFYSAKLIFMATIIDLKN